MPSSCVSGLGSIQDKAEDTEKAREEVQEKHGHAELEHRRAQTKTDKSMKALSDQNVPLGVGSYLRMTVRMPPSTDDTKPTMHSNEIVTEHDPAAYRVAWRYVPAIPGTLFAERWQRLSEVEGGKTLYETREVFGGPLAYVVRWLMRSKLDVAFEAFAASLKERAEAL
ncbi:hypothetical protein K488DRAFT_83003 [Vararia minispora EC-137]|uniref:Uncharacterized protein n=1 Tax=Vararia minispora EC-137 TaxID=1314806 RepID=A0ACB8QUW3_9AGAM|nr:hypothetical protein K488DRAFT_83003 [Vararia minispora EC-137]